MLAAWRAAAMAASIMVSKSPMAVTSNSLIGKAGELTSSWFMASCDSTVATQ